MIQKLVLDSEALATLGLGDRAVYLIEYDMHSEQKIEDKLGSDAKKELKKHNELSREFRNRLIFLLKYNLKATRHLESCWIIDENRLETAIEGLNDLKEKMKAKGFKNMDERLRIIPILTTEEGIQNYDDKKAEFLLDFTMEHVQYMENAIKTKRVANGLIWRSKKACEIVHELKEEIKTNPRYKEVVDTVTILDELIPRVEAIVKPQKTKATKKATKTTK